MSKEVVKKETKEAALTVPDAFKKKGASVSVIDQKDMLIPKLLIMQPTSEFVNEERAAVGDLVSSVTGEVVGGKGKWVKFVPLMTYKTVEYYDKSGPKPKLVKTEPWNAKTHATVEWEQTINGKPHKVMECLNFYIFLEKDLANPAGLPHLVSYRSTQKQGGKKLISHFMQMEMMQAEPWFGVLEVTTTKQQNAEKQVYFTPDIRPVGQTDVKYAEKLEKWVDLIARNAVKIDETADEELTDTRTVNKGGAEAQAQF